MTAARSDIGKTRATGGDGLQVADLSAVGPVLLPPLLAPSAGAFAAAAVMGLGFANQMAGAYIGFLKGAMESSLLMAEALGMPDSAPEQVAQAEAAPTVAKPVKAKAEAVAKTATILPMTRKKAEASPAADVTAAPEKVEAKPFVARKAAVKAKPAAKTKSAAKAKPVVPAEGAKAKAEKTPATDVTSVTAVDLTDLKRLSGIGPKLEQMLKARGIATLRDIAGLSDGQAAAIDAELGLDGRVSRDGWVSAAKALIG